MNIKPNELRPGNWVNLEFVGPFEWAWNNYEEYIKLLSDGTEVISDKIEPIPIAPEILEKAGFEYFEADDDSVPSYMKDGCPFYIDYDTMQPLNVGFHVCEYKIQYLHQLQNLYFALTGEELDVNL